jgi:hypothetical protein
LPSRYNRSSLVTGPAGYAHLGCGLWLVLVGLISQAQAAPVLSGITDVEVTVTEAVVLADTSSDVFFSGSPNPRALAFDAAGHLLIVDTVEDHLLRVSPDGVATPIGTGFSLPTAVGVNAAGLPVVADAGLDHVLRLDGGLSTILAESLRMPLSLLYDGADTLYAADAAAGIVYKVTPQGVVSSFVAGLVLPTGLALDGAGQLHIADAGTGQLLAVSPLGQSSIITDSLARPLALALDAGGDLYVAEGDAGAVIRLVAGVVVDTVSSGLDRPLGVAFDEGDNLYIAEGAGRIHRWNRGPTVRDVAAVDFDGGRVTVQLAPASIHETLAVKDQSAEAGPIGFDGSVIRFHDVVIGVASGGAGGQDLIIDLAGAAATPVAVTGLLRAVTYRNTAPDPAPTRTVTYTIEDGDGGTSTPVAGLIAVSTATQSHMFVDLPAGWNLVSVPIEVSDRTLNNIFPDAVSAFGFGGGYQFASELNSCEGYWVNLATGGTYTIAGAPLSSCVRSLPAGWSLTGTPSASSAVAQAGQNPAGVLLSTFGFSAGYAPATVVDPGVGYWVNLATAGTLTFGAEPSP